jgi:RHS repeat-associated protein
MDDMRRIALVEMRTLDTAGNDPAPARLIRYQFGNHLGSTGLELDDQAQIISYEEYAPYGSPTYQAVRSGTETPKRYRYTGMERDEESGLSYHGARYYAPWLARWVSADPAGLVDGVNLYQYSLSNPIVLFDATGRDSKLSDATGTDSKRTYQLGLGFDTKPRWNPLEDSESNTNLTALIGGFASLASTASEDSRWYWKAAVYAAIIGVESYTTVFSHEGGHKREGARQGASTYFDWTLGFIPTKTHASALTDPTLFQAGGVNQNTLNAKQMWLNTRLSGGERSFAEDYGRWANESYLAQYTARAVLNIGGNGNDLNSYASSSDTWLGWAFAAAVTTTVLNISSEQLAKKGVFGSKFADPRFQTLLTSSGQLLLGVQTLVKPGGPLRGLEFSFDSTPNVSAFSLGIKAHDIRLPCISKNLSFSPFGALSKWGLSGGADVTYDFDSRWGVRLTAGYRDSSNPLNDVEGKAAGWYGTAAATIRMGGR